MSLYEMFSRRSEWESAVGRLMLAHAHLDLGVPIAIANYAGHDSAKKVFRSGHARRLTVRESLAAGRNEETRNAVRALVDSLRAFNRQRNHIAHNSLSYALDEYSTEAHKYGSITDLVDPRRRIGLEQIQALAKKGEDLARNFNLSWIMVMGVPP